MDQAGADEGVARVSAPGDREWTDCGDPVLADQRRLCLSRH